MTAVHNVLYTFVQKQAFFINLVRFDLIIVVFNNFINIECIIVLFNLSYKYISLTPNSQCINNNHYYYKLFIF